MRFATILARSHITIRTSSPLTLASKFAPTPMLDRVICQENGHRNNKDLVLAREIPIAPWTLLEMDIFTCEEHTFLLTVDITLRFPVVRILLSETTRSVLNTIKGIYSDFGLPKEF